MSKKPAVKRPKGRAVRVEPAGDGMMARLIDQTFENPAMSGGLLVMALTFTAIVSNAMFLQRGSHPDPLFMTRPAEQHATARTAPVPAARPTVPRPDRVIATPPLPRLAPGKLAMATAEPVVVPVLEPVVAAPIPPEPIANAPSPEVVLVSAIQRELARLGLYSGTIDGLMGQRTASAIAAFETAAGDPATGQPSMDLLAAMKRPLPQRNAPPSEAASADRDVLAAELDRRERERAKLIASQEQSVAATRATANTRIVQAALNRIGYGPLPVDGSAKGETEDAIRRFELDNGMPITGMANDPLIARLIAIGAVKPG